MHKIADILQIPYDLIGWVGSLIVASSALLASAIQGLIPTPDEASAWPFYGVLIVAIVVLFLSIAAILRWVATKWMAQQSTTNSVIEEMSKSLSKVTQVLERQNAWFDEFGKAALQHQLDGTKQSVHQQGRSRG